MTYQLWFIGYGTATLVADGFRSRRAAYRYRDASAGWGEGYFRVRCVA
jgi:hypothetical protein